MTRKFHDTRGPCEVRVVVDKGHKYTAPAFVGLIAHSVLPSQPFSRSSPLPSNPLALDSPFFSINNLNRSFPDTSPLVVFCKEGC